MIETFSKIHNNFKFNREHLNHEQLTELSYSFIKEGEPHEVALGTFLLDWLDKNDFIFINTSGSTGLPKEIKILKQALINSATATGHFFNLKPGNTALHCLPAHFIAGKMMLIRAIVLGLELDYISPSSNPLKDRNRTYDFCAMVPFQLENSLNELHKIKTLIVGGATVSTVLQSKLKDITTKVFATYGMTETVTHIALKPLNHYNKDAKPYFKLLPDISIKTDERHCLIINAPNISEEQILTNDVVNLHSDTEFEFLGRADNVINSGGIKLFPELIEEKLSNNISQRFFIASEKDESLGEKLILIIEGDSNILKKDVFKNLNPYEIPKQIYAINQFKETSTGKIQRNETLKLL